jgi:hypothetical protein
MLKIMVSKADVIITSFCTIFATVIGVILGHLLQNIGKLKMYYVDYSLNFTILKSGYHTSVRLADNPNRMSMKLEIDINNTSHINKLIRDIVVKIARGKSQCISFQNEYFINGEKNASKDLLVINPLDAKRVTINAYFDKVISGLIDRNAKITVQFKDENNKKNNIFIGKLIYYNFENNKINLD